MRDRAAFFHHLHRHLFSEFSCFNHISIYMLHCGYLFIVFLSPLEYSHYKDGGQDFALSAYVFTSSLLSTHPRLASWSLWGWMTGFWSSWFHLPSVGITGTCHDSWHLQQCQKLHELCFKHSMPELESFFYFSFLYSSWSSLLCSATLQESSAHYQPIGNIWIYKRRFFMRIALPEYKFQEVDSEELIVWL